MLSWTDSLWQFIGRAATLILVFIGSTIIILPIAKKRRRRIQFSARPELSLEYWHQHLFGSNRSHMNILRIVLDAVGSAYGVASGKLRPDDCFWNDYGAFRKLIDQEDEELLRDEISKALCDKAGVVWNSEELPSKADLSEIIRTIIHSDLLCAKCHYNLRGTISKVCPECGAPIMLGRQRCGDDSLESERTL